MPFVDLLPFLLTVLMFACVPGPAVIYTAVRSLADGRTAGFMAVLGMHLAGYVHVGAAAAGLALIVQSMPVLLAGLKLMGAVYLASLGIALLWAQPSRARKEIVAPALTGCIVAEGMTVQVLNPAAAIFYVAFLPQFVDPSSSLPVWVQFVLLGTVVNIIITATKVPVVMLAGTAMACLQQPARGHRHVQRVAGSTLLGLAVHLAVWESLM